MPRSPGVMRPSGLTAAASVMTSAGSADCAAAEVDEVPVVGVAVDRAVLAHGRDDDAVGEGDAALGERGEEAGGRGGGFGHGSWMALGDDSIRG